MPIPRGSVTPVFPRNNTSSADNPDEGVAERWSVSKQEICRDHSQKNWIKGAYGSLIVSWCVLHPLVDLAPGRGDRNRNPLPVRLTAATRPRRASGRRGE